MSGKFADFVGRKAEEGVSLREIGRLTGYSAPHLSKVASGQASLTTDLCKRLYDKVGMKECERREMYLDADSISGISKDVLSRMTMAQQRFIKETLAHVHCDTTPLHVIGEDVPPPEHPSDGKASCG